MNQGVLASITPMTAAAPTPAPPAQRTLRAVSWNLMSYGKSGLPTRRQQHELLRFLRPDIVCLQEIYTVGGDAGELDRLVNAIADALGMVAFTVPAKHSDCHLAILWRPEYAVLSQRAYDLLMWHGLGVVRLDVGAPVPLTVAVTHLAPWNPDKQLADAYTLTGQLPLSDATILAADWNSFGADPNHDPEPDWTALPTERIARHIRWNDDSDALPVADRRPSQMMQRSGFHDAAPHLGMAWKATSGHRGGWSRREDVFWTNRPQALRSYQVIDTPAARALSDHLPIMVDLDPQAMPPSASPAPPRRAEQP
ncbi:endonuclease/exonuclease/phosphatase family protein [Micromonospora sp. RP3T]|uniref:endonuclease/exonuclease/phosphatase family protein n=1 Tax=Micromonospora sp. RP3T TaxID=2135446 RepID=UPI001304F8E7|nr:endonuclease/exonuclease/phosphatase family protein [Micromonospora sp. RP3T]